MTDPDRPDDAPRGDSFRILLDPEDVERSIDELADRLRKQYDRHRNSKVRLTYKGRPLVEDLPLAVFLAGEAASLWWLGPARILLVNLGLRAFLDVQIVNDADDFVAKGNQHYLDGEIDEAEAAYREALELRPNDPSALYHLGVLLRVTGRRDEAVDTLQRAADWGDHPDAHKASQLLVKMKVRHLIPKPRA